MVNHKPLEMFSKQTDELKKLISEYPDYPIVVIVGYEVVADDGGWWYAPSLSFSLGEILDCELDFSDKIFTDRDEFEEYMQDYLCDLDDTRDMSDDEYIKFVKSKLAEYEPYWKKVIQIRADV